MTSRLITAMIQYFGELKYVEHALKVYGYAHAIGGESGLGEDDLRILDAAAVLHDIGIPQAIRVYGSGHGPYQEREGAIVSAPMLREAGFSGEEAGRVTALISRHHTPEAAKDDPLLRMLMEADYLVNFSEGNLPGVSVRDVYEDFFRTPAAREYLQTLYAGVL